MGSGYRIEYSKKSEKFLKGQNSEQAIKRDIEKTIGEFLNQPMGGRVQPYTKMGKNFFYFRYRRKYRVIFERIKSERKIEIVQIGSRGDVYKK